MPPERTFLGWDEFVTESVSRALLPDPAKTRPDLSRHLVVAPTRQAGRRLREGLARRCAEHGLALLAPRVVSPPALLRVVSAATQIANLSLVYAVWAEVLSGERWGEYPALFPTRPADPGFSWALQTGRMIQNLRNALADDGTMIRDVVRTRLDDLLEPERWRDLARLEEAYLDRMNSLGREDPVESEIRAAADPILPDGVERITVAAVPDPTRLMIRALECLADRVPITVLVHAPEAEASAFDEWGRPIAEVWRDTRIDIPDPEKNLVLAGPPADQARQVAALILDSDSPGSAGVAIGVPDRSVIPALTSALTEIGLTAYDPAGRPLSESTCATLLHAWTALVEDADAHSLRTVLRHPAMLEFLSSTDGIRTDRLLAQWDRFQNRHLPSSLDDVQHHLGRYRKTPGNQKNPFDALECAVRRIASMIDEFSGGSAQDAISGFLQLVYSVRLLDSRDADDQEFASAADELSNSVNELMDPAFDELKWSGTRMHQVLWTRMSDQSVYSERPPDGLDLEGWLELPWNSAPLLVVTGMNEGRVPAGYGADVFLPNAMREQLGLRHDADRFARDAYVMRSMMESRRCEGRTVFVAGKTSADGDPLHPSRLLFRCSDEELSARVELLFGDPAYVPESAAPGVSFALDPRPAEPGAPLPSSLRVTSFSSYLACPFRFYLKNVLGMEKLDDLKDELDALDFGILVHHALHRMTQDGAWAACTNAEELGRYLGVEAERWVRDRYGPRIPLQVEIQLRAAQQRLAAAARVQVEHRNAGWDIEESEFEIDGVIGGMGVRGRVDRIDRHRHTGELLVLDYKSSDKAADPAASHLGTARQWTRPYALIDLPRSRKAWTNLQLPLYRILLRGKGMDGPMKLGYFNLPKATQDTSVQVWENLDETALQSAQSCAVGVVGDLRAGRFWPPAPKIVFDDFECLFHGDVEQNFRVAEFLECVQLDGEEPIGV